MVLRVWDIKLKNNQTELVNLLWHRNISKAMFGMEYDRNV